MLRAAFRESIGIAATKLILERPASDLARIGEAFQLALRAALALNCDISLFTKWDRKQYYYPDLPKGYQISQYESPICQHGWIEIVGAEGTKRVRIRRAHLEEDAGEVDRLDGDDFFDLPDYGWDTSSD